MMLVILLSILYLAISIFVIIRYAEVKKDAIREFLSTQKRIGNRFISTVEKTISARLFKKQTKDLPREESVVHE